MDVKDVVKYLNEATMAAGLTDAQQKNVLIQFAIAFGSEIGAGLERARFNEIVAVPAQSEARG